jgi:predicted neutral ceramidase superfamily lipid hydrolase
VDHDDRPLKSVEELFKTLATTSGIMLALLWGLTQRTLDATVLCTIRIASIILVFSILVAILGLQFIVSRLESNATKITKQASVAYCFMLAWLSFIAGCVAVILAIFQVN